MPGSVLRCGAGAGGGEVLSNDGMRLVELRQHCKLDEAGRIRVRPATRQARTIADLDGSGDIQPVHLA